MRSATVVCLLALTSVVLGDLWAISAKNEGGVMQFDGRKWRSHHSFLFTGGTLASFWITELPNGNGSPAVFLSSDNLQTSADSVSQTGRSSVVLNAKDSRTGASSINQPATDPVQGYIVLDVASALPASDSTSTPSFWMAGEDPSNSANPFFLQKYGDLSSRVVYGPDFLPSELHTHPETNSLWISGIAEYTIDANDNLIVANIPPIKFYNDGVEGTALDIAPSLDDALLQDFPYSIRAMEYDPTADVLYVGGIWPGAIKAFAFSDGPGSTGTWEDLGEGLIADEDGLIEEVRTIEVVGDKIYVGGIFSGARGSGNGPTEGLNNLAVFSRSSGSWSAVGSGVASYGLTLRGDVTRGNYETDFNKKLSLQVSGVSEFHACGDYVYVAGDFDYVVAGSPKKSHHLAVIRASTGDLAVFADGAFTDDAVGSDSDGSTPTQILNGAAYTQFAVIGTCPEPSSDILVWVVGAAAAAIVVPGALYTARSKRMSSFRKGMRDRMSRTKAPSGDGAPLTAPGEQR